MTRTAALGPTDLVRRVQALETKVQTLETTPGFAAGRAKGGTTYWSDGVTDQIIIGLESDGTYAVWVGASLKIQATGPNAGQLLGLVALALSGLLSANGGLQVPDHNGSTNVPTVSSNGAKIWVQSTDPGAAAAEGDVWVQA